MKRLLYLTVLLVSTCVMVSGSAKAQGAGGGSFYYVNGRYQYDTMCENAAALNIDSYITTFDSTAGQTLYWYDIIAPAHGSITGLLATGVSVVGNNTPSGVTYQPTTGYIGVDSVEVVGYNGTDTIYTTIIFDMLAPSVSPITGGTTVCVERQDTLTDSVSGGTWSSSNTSVGTITSAGILTGVGTGTTVVTYVDSTLRCGSQTFTVTVNRRPGYPTGPSTVCTGDSVLISDTSAGGSWSVSSGTIANIESSGELIGGGATGTVYITYTLPNGCYSLKLDTVKGPVGPITGASALCIGDSVALADTSRGGTWKSSTTAVTLSGTSGSPIEAFGNATGTSVITYSISAGCYTSTSITVGAGSLGNITGTNTVCVGGSVTLTDSSATSGAVWTGSPSSVATIGSTTGVVTGVTAGIYVCTLSVASGCAAGVKTYTVTILPSPTVGPINGATTVCPGGTITLTDTTGGGVWSTTSTGVASVNATTGVVTGITNGVATITYLVPSACGTIPALYTVTVSAASAVSPISGASTVCLGSTLTLTDATSGGTWVSSNTSIATVSGGIVSTAGVGTAIISYGISGSCGSSYATLTVTVNPLPGPIIGSHNICLGGTVTLTDTTSGGTWVTSNTTVASVGSSSGVFTGLSLGVTFTTYTNSYGCHVTVADSVISGVKSITGRGAICIGSTTTLSDSTGSGTWSSGNTLVATIGSSTGVLTGVGSGTVNIAYTLGSGCAAVFTETVAPIPVNGAITGGTSVCTGSTITLTSAGTAGGTWTSNNTAAATIGASSGIVTGVAAGATTITYTISNACGTKDTTINITVNAGGTVAGITGTFTVCAGANTTLSDGTSGGTWISGNTAVATVSGGVVTGVSGGTAVISYQITGSCGTHDTTATVTVSPLPALSAISGTTNICIGYNVTLSDTYAGGTWTSSNTAIATVGASSGVVAGIAVGSATITYTATNGCGTKDTTIGITVTPVPNAGTITGATSVCVGSAITLADATGTTGGSWISGSTSVATVSATGVVTGVSAGTVNITYSVVSSCLTSTTYTTITVSPIPAGGTITGSSSVCQGSTITLTDASGTAGGTWSSNNTAVATTSGDVVTGVSGGSAIISYTISNGCGTASATYSVAVTALGSAGTISGASAVCVSGNTTLSETISGGTWSVTNSHAVVSSAGVVFGASAGIDTIKYAIPSSCGSSYATFTISVVPASGVSSIVGPTDICLGSTGTLTDSTAGGTWLSSNNTIATVSGGVVTGVTSGDVVITYQISTSCGLNIAIKDMVVGTSLSPGTISGGSSACVGSFVNLTESASGGTWSASNANATVSSGVVSGVTAGVDTIYYTIVGSCGTVYTTHIVTVTPVPSTGTISGPTSVCLGSSINLTETVGTGTWSSSNPSIATITASGQVTGVAAGSVTIYYTITGACGTLSSNYVVTVNPLPNAGTITGATTVCTGTNSTLSDAVAGGTWSSSNTAIATVSATGVVTGVNTGVAQISYAVSTGCGTAIATTNVTINLSPSAGTITGGSNVCVGTTLTLSDGTSGGAWSSSNSLVASVSTSGVVTGVATGSATITYGVTSSCGSAITTQTVTVSPAPNAGIITGTTAICTGTNTTLVDTTSGGTWSSANTAIATVSATGVVTAVGVGTVNIYYTVVGPCSTTDATVSVFVSLAPNAGTITGGGVTICAGNNVSLSDASSGGTWSSSNASVATVGGSGVVTGHAEGTAIISYIVSTGCGTAVATTNVTVNPLPNAGFISGSTVICTGTNSTLTDAASGGVWSTSNAAVATVSATGVVSAVAVGSASIYYTVTNSCGSATATATVSVDLTASAGTITGGSSVCTGSTLSLSDAAGGGTWISSNTAVATVNSSGVVTGVTNGTATITYLVSSSCGSVMAVDNITVSTFPNAGVITGTAVVCVASTTSLTESVTGGTWSSGNTSIATVNSSGVVTGVGSGVVNIYYTVTNSCGTTNATVSVAVSLTPDAGTITGASSVCAGSTITLTESVSGGSWTSSNPAVAMINSAGVATGVSAGSATITYTNNNGCGVATTIADITVNSTGSGAGTITGVSTLCLGTSATFSDAVGGGLWTSSNPSVASVNSSGVVTGNASGTATISYSVPTGCGAGVALQAVTVSSSASAGTITGAATVCNGFTTTLADAVTGGSWTSSNPAIASISSGGVVTGVANGSVTITYAVTTSCGSADTTISFTVTTTPYEGVIVGATTICAGSTSSLTETVAGGTWSSGNPAVATINTSGVVTAVSVGSDIITYMVTNACGTSLATADLTIGAAPNTGTITGGSSVCVGSTATVIDTADGSAGNWSSSNASIARISASGVVTGVTTGVVTLSYGVTNSCGTAYAVRSFSVVSSPTSAGTITGSAPVCPGATVTLTDAVGGGTWSSSNTAVATVNAAGVVTGVTGVAGGSATITYTISNACGSTYTTTTETINVGPEAGTIAGTLTTICAGTTVTLYDFTGGGTWSSSDPTIATISTSGVVSGISAGTTNISYTVSNSCGSSSAVVPVTIDPLPALSAISGPTNLCLGSTGSLSDVVSGGTWTSSNSAIESINASGVATGNAIGNAIITYSVTNVYGCSASVSIEDTVSGASSVAAISGSEFVCVGSAVILTDATGGGTWSSDNTAIATVNAFGTVNGVTAGTANIYYTVVTSAGCSASTSLKMTVNPLPTVSAISGAGSVCPGTTETLADATSGGVWGATNSNAMVSSAGVVTGNTLGSDTILYTVSNTFGCSASADAVVTINATPVIAAINGASSICLGSSVSLTDATGGGTWSSSNASVATISSSGVLQGVALGTVTITYAVSGGVGCAALVTMTDTVENGPAIAPASGATHVCVGATANLTDATTGGVWSTTDSAVATVNPSTGVVNGIAAGTVNILYSVSSGIGCTSSISVSDTVYSGPAVAAITGSGAVCLGGSTTLSDFTPSGSWSASNSTVASVSTSGVVTAMNTGSDTVYYTVTNSEGCTSAADLILNIDTIPSASILPSGGASICHGNPVDLYINGATSGMSYQWFDNGVAIAGATSDSYVADTVGLFSVSISIGSCSETLAGTNVIGQPNPVIGLDHSDILFTGSFSTYQWLYDGSPISGANSSTYVESTNGNYQVIVTNRYGCVDTSNVYVVGPLSVANVNGVNNEIKIYPNPATSVINIEASVVVNIVVTSLDGKVVIRADRSNQVDVSNLAGGMYMIMVYDENNSLLVVTKIVKSE